MVLKWTVIVFGIFIILNLLAYVVFTRIALPYTSVHGLNLGFNSYSSIESNVNNHIESKPINFSVQGESQSLSYKDLGIVFSSEKTFAHQKNIDGFWNLPLIQALFGWSTTTTPMYEVDQTKTKASLAKFVDEVDLPAVNAALIIPDNKAGEVKISDDTSGSLLNTQVAYEQFIDSMSSGSINIYPRRVAPAVLTADLELARDEAQSLLSRTLIINDEDGKKVTEVDPENFMPILTNDGSKLAIKKKKLDQYVHEELALYFYQAPIPKRIDGGIVNEAGKTGVGLDEKEAKQILGEAFIDPDIKSVNLSTSPIKPPEIVDGIYPKTDAGLSALIQDFNNSKYGEYRIIVREMKDGGLGGSVNAVKDIIPASTYKAFIAYAALKSIERGEMTLESVTNHGTVRACIHEMIHVSTDHCAIAIQDYMGWQKVDKLIHEAGFVNTHINNQGWQSEKWTTALDEYRLIRGLQDGTLLSKAHTEHLLNEMKNQMWRSGIPAGSAPAVVADKVGFYAGRENDVGIVYAPKGEYIIIAMSHGGSFYEISQLARQVYQFFGN